MTNLIRNLLIIYQSKTSVATNVGQVINTPINLS